jgi:Cu/Ag efflux protein CusF
MIQDANRSGRAASFRSFAILIAPLLIAGCVSSAPVELAQNHPANPKASSGYSGESTVLASYKTPDAFIAQANEDAQSASMQGMAGMDHSAMAAMPGMNHGVMQGMAGTQPAGGTTVAQAQQTSAKPTGTATVNKVDPAQHKVNLSHDPIPSIGWPAMTMDFPVAPSADLAAVKPGGRVTFTMSKDQAGMYRIDSIRPSP